MGVRIAAQLIAWSVVAAAVTRMTMLALDLGHAQRTWVPVMAVLMAVALSLRGWPRDVDWARRAATALAVGTAVLCVFFLLGHATGYQPTVLAGVYPIGAVDPATLPYEGRPAPVSLLLVLMVAVAIMVLDHGARWAARTSGALIVVLGSSAAWLLTELAFPSAFGIEDFFQSTTAATASSALMLLGIAIAAALSRPYRLPVGPLLSTRMWPLLVISTAMLVVGTIVAQLAYRLVIEAGAQLRTAVGVGYFFQACSVIGLVVLSVWYASVQQRRWTQQTQQSASAEAFASVVYSSAVAMTVLDQQGRILDVNTAYEQLLGRRAEDVIGRHRSEFLLPGSDLKGTGEPLNPSWWSMVRDEGGTHRERLEFRHASGRAVWADSTVSIARDPLHQGADLLLEQLVDATAAQAVEQELAFRSSHDALTGQLTRNEITEHLDRSLAPPGRAMLVAIVGLDRFRLVNEAYGHVVGDLVLVEAARRLAAAVAPSGVVGRVAGDEFAVVLPLRPGDAAGTLRRTAEWLITSVEQDLTVAGVVVRTAASIGVQVGNAGDSGSMVLANAASALAQAKRDGGRRWQSFDHTSEGHARERMLLLNQLRASMREDADNFQTWFQPIVSLDTMETVAYEALIRWHSPERGIVPAGAWIEAAESDLPLIHQIALITARQAQAFAATLPAGMRVSINVSGAHVSSRDFAEFTEAILDAHRTAPGRLVLELTETTLASVQGPSRNRLQQLVDAGVGLWGDDFGTGYSSVAHLRDLPLTGLKLDKSFTAGLTDPASTTFRIADGLAGLAHGLGLETIAEGVETPQQATRVAAAGWHLGQGWLYGRPNPAEHWSRLSVPDAD